MSQDAQVIANDLYSLVNALDPLPAPGSTAALALSQRCDELLLAVQRFRDSAAANREKLAASLERVAAGLRTLTQYLPSAPDLPSFRSLKERMPSPDLTRLRETRAWLMDGYEQLLVTLRSYRLAEVGSLPGSLRPRNYVRNVFHVANALVGAGLYEWVLDRTGCLFVLGTMLLTYLTAEFLRRAAPRVHARCFDGVFRHITRPRERYELPAAVWYTVAILLVTAFASQTVAQLAVLIVGFGDPVASICGKRWGRRKLFGRKTWVGTGAFVVAATLTCAVFLVAARDLALPTALGIALAGAVAGAVAEVVSDDRIDDNFSVPVAAALVLVFLV